jgi:hypothetical protein
MNPPVDLEQAVTAWLRQQASASGSDRVVAATLERAATVRQDRRRPTWLHLPMRPTQQMAIVAATAVVIAVASFGLLAGSLDVGPGFVGGSTPAPSSTLPPCPRPPEPMNPGPNVITDFAPITLTISLPDSWRRYGCWEVASAGQVYPVVFASPASGPGAIGFTTADPVPARCEGFPGWNRAEVEIDGFAGERLDYSGGFALPESCHPNYVMDYLGERSGRGPETLFTLWMLDVKGERFSMFAWIKLDHARQAADDARQAELQRLIEAVHIEASVPSPSPTPTAAVYPSGFQIPPADRQSLTVDGVPLSFSVPTEGWMPGIQLKKPDGTMPARSLYLGKSIVRGQAAEAVVFWTAFPDGINTDACAKLLGSDIGPSAVDLAAAMTTAPGTDLVTGPSDVTLGGREAKHVVLTVRERLGCDPGFFFSWPDECWGACWTSTQVGDEIGVWVVDVDGTRLVIETETSSRPDPALKPEVQQLLESALVLEVRQIVESIRFE